jgi:hypothetical protein
MFYDIYDLYRKYAKNVYVVVNVETGRVCGFILIKIMFWSHCVLRGI